MSNKNKIIGAFKRQTGGPKSMLSKQERALIIHWHEEKKASIRSISKILGVSRNTVRHWLRAGTDTAPRERAVSTEGSFMSTLQTSGSCLLTARCTVPRCGCCSVTAHRCAENSGARLSLRIRYTVVKLCPGRICRWILEKKMFCSAVSRCVCIFSPAN